MRTNKSANCFLPAHGEVMGSRSGDLDPAVPLHLIQELGYSVWDGARCVSLFVFVFVIVSCLFVFHVSSVSDVLGKWDMAFKFVPKSDHRLWKTNENKNVPAVDDSYYESSTAGTFLFSFVFHIFFNSLLHIKIYLQSKQAITGFPTTLTKTTSLDSIHLDQQPLDILRRYFAKQKEAKETNKQNNIEQKSGKILGKTWKKPIKHTLLSQPPQVLKSSRSS